MSSSVVFETLRNYMSASQSKCYFPHPLIVQRRRMVNQHFTFSENKWTTALSYWNSLCSFHHYLQLFVGWFMPYLRHLWLFAHSGVQHILCCVFYFACVLCAPCFRFLWIVHYWLPLRYSLAIIFWRSRVRINVDWPIFRLQ